MADWLEAVGRSQALTDIIPNALKPIQQIEGIRALQQQQAISRQQMEIMQQTKRMNDFKIRESEKQEEENSRGWDPTKEELYQMMTPEDQEKSLQELSAGGYTDPNTNLGTQRDKKRYVNNLENSQKQMAGFIEKMKTSINIQWSNKNAELVKEKEKGLSANAEKVQKLTAESRALQTKYEGVIGQGAKALKMVAVNEVIGELRNRPSPIEGLNMVDYLAQKNPSLAIAIKIGNPDEVRTEIDKVMAEELKERMKSSTEVDIRTLSPTDPRRMNFEASTRATQQPTKPQASNLEKILIGVYGEKEFGKMAPQQRVKAFRAISASTRPPGTAEWMIDVTNKAVVEEEATKKRKLTAKEIAKLYADLWPKDMSFMAALAQMAGGNIKDPMNLMGGGTE